MQLIFNDLDDIEMELPMFSTYLAPKKEHVVRLVAFGRAMESLPDWGLLVHCDAGISRSTASAITVITAAGFKPAVAFGMVRRSCPEMLPNRRILRMADDILQTGGKLYHMAEVHRRKAFLCAGYEDPTLVRQREAQEEAARGQAGPVAGRFGFWQRLCPWFFRLKKQWRSAPHRTSLPPRSASTKVASTGLH